MSMPAEPLAQVLEEARRKGKLRAERFGDLAYLRLTDDLRRVPRGTVVHGGEAVYGYPRIGRILHLARGLREQFRHPVWVEEKIDGYNVRICRLGGRPVALTRGGFVCPFTTDRLPELLDLRLLEEEPDLVICAEVAGPENPYLEGGPPFIPEDVQLFVFDLMRRGRPGFLPREEVYARVEAYGLPAVPRYGRHGLEEVAALRALMKRLEEKGAEGIVLKEDAPEGRRAKYTTAYACVQDLRAGADAFTDLPPEYFTGRILRLALYLEEQGYAGEALEQVQRRLGAALVEGLLDAVARFRREGRVAQVYRCRLRSREAAEALLAHLRAGAGHAMRIVQRELRREGEHWRLVFERQPPSLNGLLGHLLRGGLVYD
ncbi:MAG: RNA ligase [Gammaproteobacteria bacterium]|nr:MAG: RNA ligase [Gammaproteobacteria bacterium]